MAVTGYFRCCTRVPLTDTGQLTGLQGTRFFCTVPTQSGGKTRVLAVRNNAVRRLPKGNLMCQSTVGTTSSTFSSIQKIAVAKHAAFKRHVPPQSVHKIHNIYKPKPPSPPSPPTPPTTLVIARPPIKAVIASSPHRGVSPSLRRIPAYIVTSHTGLHCYVLIAYRYTHRCCVAYRTSRCVAYRY